MRYVWLLLFISTFAFGIDSVKNALATQENLVVLFMRPTCSYSLYLRPIMDKVFIPYKESVTYIVIDITTGEDYYKKEYHFSTVPTVLYYKNGIVKAHHGSNNKTIDQRDIKEYIKRVYDL